MRGADPRPRLRLPGGTMLAGHTVKGQFATITPGRATRRSGLGWSVLTTQLNSSGEPFQTISHPFLLSGPNGCTSTDGEPQRPPKASPGASAAQGPSPSLVSGSQGPKRMPSLNPPKQILKGGRNVK